MRQRAGRGERAGGSCLNTGLYTLYLKLMQIYWLTNLFREFPRSSKPKTFVILEDANSILLDLPDALLN